MATTAIALSDQQLEAELRQLQTDSVPVRKKLDDETRKLDAARTERQRIVDGIGRGIVKESEAPRIKAEIEQIEIRIEGLNSLHAEKRSSMNTLQVEFGRRQAAAAKAAHAKEFAELNEKGVAIAGEIVEDLMRLTEGLRAFDLVRFRLGSAEFRDLDGEGSARELRELLWKAPGPQETLRSPETHIRKLLDDGWRLYGEGTAERVPGGNLSLQILSMRPKG
jgi:hypothetical protein